MPLPRPTPFPSDEAYAKPSPPPVPVSEETSEGVTPDQVAETDEIVDTPAGPAAAGPDESEWDPEDDGITDQELADKLSASFTKPQLYEQAQRLGVPGVKAHSNKPEIVAALVDAFRDEMVGIVP